MNSKPVIIAGCLIEKDNKFLLIQEAKPQAYELWNIPAGHVDDGESLEEAAIREVKEESGFDVVIDRELGVYLTPSKHEIHVFQAHILDGRLLFPEDEILDARWFTYNEIKVMDDEKQLRGQFVLLAMNKCLETTP